MSFESILTSFSLGLLATTNPCILPLYPGYLAYLSGSHSSTGKEARRYFLGFFVLLGMLSMMLLLGLGIALLSISVGRALGLIIPLADLMILLLGVALLLDRNPFKSLPQVQVPVISNPYANAFLYGVLYGPIALPCSGPFIVSIFAVSLTGAEVLGRLTTFLWFGVGFGLPLLLLSFLSSALQRWITRQFAINARLINLIGGVLLIGIAIYDFWNNWELISLLL